MKTTFNLPNGALVTAPRETAAYIWALYFAHAQKGMGLEIKLEGGQAELCSVYAPNFGATHISIDLANGKVTELEHNEQNSLCSVVTTDPEEKNFMIAARKAVQQLTLEIA